MKQLILSLLLAVCTVCTAQTNHMKFKGVPMEGTLESFTSKLEAKGFTPDEIENGISRLDGEFAAYKDCKISVIADISGLIYKVSVEFPKMDKWGNLWKNYNDLKKMLTEKYGSPKICLEQFFDPNIINDDKIYAIQHDKYIYYSVFSLEEGDIRLEISHESIYSCFVTLTYLDNINQEKVQKQIMDDL